MKKKIRLLGMLTFAFVIFITSVGASAAPLKNNDIDQNYLDFLELNWNRTALAEKIDKRLNDYYKNSYPSYFGGMYISDDSQNLIIQIVKNYIPSEDSSEYSIYVEIINMDSSITVEYVNNSFSQLNNLNDKISEYFLSSNADENLKSNYIDVINNVVTVELSENSERKQESLKNNVINNRNTNSTLITFIKSEEYSTFASVSPGGYLYTGTGSCSMAFRTKINGKIGYVTAGHCFTGVGISIPSGTVKIRQFANEQNYDYAFVEANSSYYISNRLTVNISGMTELAVINNSCPYFAVGTVIAKVGDKTGYTDGKVTALKGSAKADGIKINGLVKSNLKSDRGDSGGVVFIPRQDSAGGPIPIGIVSAGSPGILGIGVTMFFTDIGTLPVEFISGRY